MLPLSAYEEYYRNNGLTEYEGVFSDGTEKDLEARLSVSRLARWRDRTRGPVVRVLDIGCGLGAFTCKLLDGLFPVPSEGRGRTAVHCDLIDIQPAAFGYFRQRAARVAGCDVTIGATLEARWPDVQATHGLAGYDLIVANHTFYGRPCDNSLIRSLLGAMAPGALAIVALSSGRSQVLRLRRAAGLELSSGEDFEAALNTTLCAYTRILCDNSLHIDTRDRSHLDWLFAATTVNGKQERIELVHRHGLDREGATLIPNTTIIHLVEDGPTTADKYTNIIRVRQARAEAL